INQICDKHGLEFADRSVFVDRHCVRLLGKVMEYSQGHTGYRRKSVYEARRKQKAKGAGKYDWGLELDRTQLSKDQARSLRSEVLEQLGEIEAQLRKLKDELAVKEQNQALSNQKDRENRLYRKTIGEQVNYQQLCESRKDVRRLPNGQVVFAGTDYGIVTMSETVPQTLTEIKVHLNRFCATQ
ncbi:hypothetical protein BGW38_007572, partial [Lunasporangiospora selenospora]